jgi:hypothetical protein
MAMKTMKIALSGVFVLLSFVAFGQAAKMDSKMNTYFVQMPHNPDQCMNMMTEMKGKGDAFLSKFEFGCMSGNHTAYAFLEGTSEDNVKQMLPKEAQATAKISKVDKLNAKQIEDMHKQHGSK